MRSWGSNHATWLSGLHFEEPALEAVRIDLWAQVQQQGERVRQLEVAIDEAVKIAPPQMQAVIAALQALRGVAQVTAATVVAELGQVSRFTSPRQLMSYVGIVPSEHSSGQRTVRMGITRTGNAHLRRVICESAWCYRFPPKLFPGLLRRQTGLDEEVKSIAWKAQHRLHKRYRTLTHRGKSTPLTVTAVGRELLGFIWAIGCHVERKVVA
jgi:transposase